VANKTLYTKNVVVNGCMSLQDGGTAPASAISGTGWTVGKLATPNFAIMSAGTKPATTAFAATDALTTATFTAASCWRSENPFNGTFASDFSWLLFWSLRNTAGASQTGQVRARVWKSSSPTGVGATQLTTGILTGTTCSALVTTTSAQSQITWTPGVSFTFNNEYLFVQVEWSIVVASTQNTGDVLFYIDPQSSIATPTFLPALTGTLSATDPAGTSNITGKAGAFGTLSGTDPAGTSSITGTSETPGTLAATEAPDTASLTGTVADPAITGTGTGVIAAGAVTLAGVGSVTSTALSAKVQFRGRTIVEGNSGTIAWPVGTIAGDSATLYLWGNGTQAITGSGWTQDITQAQFNEASFYSVWHKVGLSAAEIASPFTYSGCDYGGYDLYVVSSADRINFIANNPAYPTTSNPLPGFTKDAASSLISTSVVIRNFAPISPVPPTGFTDRGPVGMTYFTCNNADIDSAAYTNGASITWTGLDVNGSSGAVLYEFCIPLGEVVIAGSLSATEARDTANFAGSVTGTYPPPYPYFDTLYNNAPITSFDPSRPTYEIGVQFTPIMDGAAIYAVRYWRFASLTRTQHYIVVWRNSDQTLLARELHTGEPSAEGWVEHTLSTPIPITGGKNYTVSWTTGDPDPGIPSILGFFPKTVDNIFYITGCYGASGVGGDFPSNVGNAGYGIEPLIAGPSLPDFTDTIYDPAATTTTTFGGDYELGLQFNVTHSGYVYGVRYYHDVTQARNTHTVKLWSDAGTLLKQVTTNNEPSLASQWLTALFATPQAVTAGNSYIVSYDTFNEGFFYIDGISTSEVVRTNLTYPANGSCYAAPHNNFPITHGSAGYCVEPLFSIESVAQPSITGTLAATGALDTASITGSIPAVITGTLAATGPADTASFAGVGASVGTSVIAASASTLTGIGVTTSTGTGVLVAGTSLLTGSIGVTGSTGIGVIVANAAILTSTGIVASTGTLAATGVIDTASITGTSITSGTLVVTGAIDTANFTVTSITSGTLTATGAIDTANFTVIGASSGSGIITAGSSTLIGFGVTASIGAGTLVAGTSTVAGVGVTASVGTAVIAASPSAVIGSGIVISVGQGIGQLAAGSATLTGSASARWISSGTLSASVAAVSGIGASAWVATGILSARQVVVVGTGTAFTVTSGVLTASAFTLSGSGTSASTGLGTVVARSSAVAGAGNLVSSLSGTLVAQSSTITGVGVTASRGTGVLVAGTSTILGTSGPLIALGTAVLTAGTATLNGIGVTITFSTGVLNTSVSTLTGSGFIASVGAGALVSNASQLVGAIALATAGTGALAAQASSITGAVSVVYNATGSLNSSAALVAGTGQILDRIVGTGTLVAARSIVSSGIGQVLDRILGTGDLVVASPTLAGDGKVYLDLPGVGVLVSGNAQIIGHGAGELEDIDRTIHGIKPDRITVSSALDRVATGYPADDRVLVSPNGEIREVEAPMPVRVVPGSTHSRVI
jgi:hypothetical protein